MVAGPAATVTRAVLVLVPLELVADRVKVGRRGDVGGLTSGVERSHRADALVDGKTGRAGHAPGQRHASAAGRQGWRASAVKLLMVGPLLPEHAASACPSKQRQAQPSRLHHSNASSDVWKTLSGVSRRRTTPSNLRPARLASALALRCGSHSTQACAAPKLRLRRWCPRTNARRTQGEVVKVRCVVSLK